MHIGDTWEYRCIQWPTFEGSDTVLNWTSFTWTITGDTVLPNSKKYFVYNDNRYIRIDTSSLCVYEYKYDGDYDMLYLYCCADTEIVFGNEGIGYFIINHLYEDRLFIDHGTLISESYILLRNCGILVYSAAECGPAYEMSLVSANVNGQVFNLTSQIEPELEVLRNFQLGKNYPNPFNALTSIPYAINQGGNVKIYIRDIRGNTVDVLVNKYHGAGEYIIEWNASGFASGIYFYCLEIDHSRKYGKCLLIK